jgi:mersacidin/lichenicidin family type 2 lantibiotic
MLHNDAVRAWKDRKYRLSLTEAERMQLPAHPAGAVELTNADLGVVSGSATIPLSQFCTLEFCTIYCPTALGCTGRLCISIKVPPC